MATLDFPSNPTNGQKYTNAGVTYIWNNANGTWDLEGDQFRP